METDRDTYDRTVFGRVADVETGHFWFEERRRLIQWSLRRYFPEAVDFCEVGCGTGFVLAGLERDFPALCLTGIEYYEEALPYAARRLVRTRLLTGDIGRLPFKEAFDVVGCFDVLEHIPDDLQAITNLADSLRAGGGLIITVPQHPWLWGIMDDIGHHQRRYTRVEMVQKLASCGLVCRRVTSFMTLLLPVMWLSRRMARSADAALGELKPSWVANFIGGALLAGERCCIRWGAGFPFGGSLLIVAVKAGAPA